MEELIDIIFGDRLRELRESNYLSQVQLAKVLGVKKQTLCDWEHGRSRARYEKLWKIADFFNVTLDYLLGREN